MVSVIIGIGSMPRMVSFERYCGYLEKVAHGSIKFEGDTGGTFNVAWLLFKNGDKKELVSKVLIGDDRIDSIKPLRHYYLAIKKYTDGAGFPRVLEVVESCDKKGAR
jgi:hypothetical protein